jgi:IclR family transcriptional regulator, pca regulon regulatory protein
MIDSGARVRARNGKAAAEGAGEEVRHAEQVEPFAGDPDFMASLARGLAVIRAFSGRTAGASTIAELSLRTGIPRSAVRRCLHTLGKLGYVAAEGRRYSLRPKVLSLGAAYASSTTLTTAAQRYLDQVSGAVRESCSLSVLDEGEILYLIRSATSVRIMSVDLRPGSRLPAYCTSMGRVLLAHLPPPELRAYLQRTRLAAHTDRTITTRDRLVQALEAVRKNGYALVDQELELGLRSIAVPVHDAAGAVVAAMNVGTQAARVPMREMERRFLRPLQAAAAELGLLLRG